MVTGKTLDCSLSSGSADLSFLLLASLPTLLSESQLSVNSHAVQSHVSVPMAGTGCPLHVSNINQPTSMNGPSGPNSSPDSSLSRTITRRSVSRRISSISSSPAQELSYSRPATSRSCESSQRQRKSQQLQQLPAHLTEPNVFFQAHKSGTVDLFRETFMSGSNKDADDQEVQIDKDFDKNIEEKELFVAGESEPITLDTKFQSDLPSEVIRSVVSILPATLVQQALEAVVEATATVRNLLHSSWSPSRLSILQRSQDEVEAIVDLICELAPPVLNSVGNANSICLNPEASLSVCPHTGLSNPANFVMQQIGSQRPYSFLYCWWWWFSKHPNIGSIRSSTAVSTAASVQMNHSSHSADIDSSGGGNV
ncbi:unnamed protein product, partial [Protopolystoma xenopodis]